MKAIIQRVSNASVTVDGKICGKIDAGLMVLLGIGLDDDESKAQKLADKIAAMRIFEDKTEPFGIRYKRFSSCRISIHFICRLP